MIVLKLLQFSFLMLILIYYAVNLIALHLNHCVESFYIDIILNQIKLLDNISKTFTFPCEKSKLVSSASSRIKNVAVFPARSKFPVKSIS